MAELAARLGSLATYRRDGDVYFQEDFTEGLGRWQTTLMVEPSAIVLQSDRFLSGGVCPRFDLADNNAAAAALWRYLWPTTTGRVGVAFAFDIASGVAGFNVIFRYYLDPLFYQAYLWWDNIESELKYYRGPADWPVITTTDHFMEGIHLFALIKVVVDFASMNWVRVSINDAVYDMAGIPLYYDTEHLGPYYYLQFTVNGVAVGTRESYLDNVVVTRNEV